jgi:Cu(I)/Ag(I) efflux system membrane fusion protein
VYSPELITAQQELLEVAKTKQLQPELYEAAKEKLRQWKLSESQIATIESSGIVKNNFEVVSNSTGIVTARKVNNGDYVSQGTVLYDIADLSNVWVMFDAYENDLAFINKNDKISFTVQALPGINFTGDIVFIDPVIDPVTRVAKVRVEISNQSGKLKPEMFATGLISANLTEYNDKLVIHSTDVLWTGKRSIVYVKQAGTDEFIFKIREIGIGPMLGNSYVVTDGLNEGEEIVTQGTFSVDAAAQLEGKPSMMNPSEKKNTNIETNRNKVEIKETTEEFLVSGNCEMCKERIEKAAKSVKRVTLATWTIKTKMLKVEYNNVATNTLSIQKAIAKAGHDTPNVKADDKTYSSLPECCRYRK